MQNIVNINTPFPDDLIRFKDACGKYGIKYTTLYKYTRQLNEIPFYNKGGLRISERDLRAWLKSGWVPARGQYERKKTI